MKFSEIEELLGWTTRVMSPITKPMVPVDMENGIIVAFDCEDFVVNHRLLEQVGRVSITMDEPQLLCYTFAAEINGNVETDYWPRKKDITFADLEKHIREFLRYQGLVNWAKAHIYLITHYAPAELRHIEDWSKNVNREDILIIGDDTIHFSTKGITLIDSIAFFSMGLKSVAKFVGMEKIELGERNDGKPWIEHMDEYRERYPEKFQEYAENDSVILLRAMMKFRAFFLQPQFTVDVLRIRTVPTAPALAMRLLRQRMKYHAMQYKRIEGRRDRKRKGGAYGWNKTSKIILDPDYLPIRHRAMRAYWGGRREAFGCGLYDKPIVSLDFSGHYNQCGINQPLNNCYTKWFETNDVSVIRECEGFVELKDWSFPPNINYPGLAEKIEKGTRLLCCLRGDETIITAFEMRILMDHLGLRFKSAIGRVFHPTSNEIENPVKEFLLEFRKMKDDAKRRCDDAGLTPDEDLDYYNGKLMGNSLIGKFQQAVDDDVETLIQFFEAHTPSKYHPKTRREKGKTTAVYFAPEWAALILGRARGLLAVAFAKAEAITGHTDSIVCPNNPAKIQETIDLMMSLGGSLGRQYEADGFWLLRSSVYIALMRAPDGSWVIKETAQKTGKPKPRIAHHAWSVDKHEDFYQPIIDVINGKPWTPTVLRKRHLAKITTQVVRGIPLGWAYYTEATPNIQWDFKRKLPSDFNIETDVFSKFVWTTPYECGEDAYEEERRAVHMKRIITDCRQPTKTELLARRKNRVRELDKQNWTEQAIADETGVPKSTVHDWIRNISHIKPDRVGSGFS